MLDNHALIYCAGHPTWALHYANFLLFIVLAVPLMVLQPEALAEAALRSGHLFHLH